MIVKKVIKHFLRNSLDSGVHINVKDCINNRHYIERIKCSKCRQICDAEAINADCTIELDKCIDCNICSSVCPTQTIRPPYSLIESIKHSFLGESNLVFIACNYSEFSSKDIVVTCIASLPWELLVILMSKGYLCIRTGECNKCKFRELRQNRLEELKVHTSKIFFEKHIGFNDINPKEYTRRELANYFRMRIINDVAFNPFQHNNTKSNSLYYRKLLINVLTDNNYLREILRWTKPQFGEKCWGCCLCADVCPTGALFSGNGTLYFIPWRCTECGICLSYCPEGAISGYESCDSYPHGKGYVLIKSNLTKCGNCGHVMKKWKNKYRCLYCGESINDGHRVNRTICDCAYDDDSHRS